MVVSQMVIPDINPKYSLLIKQYNLRENDLTLSKAIELSTLRSLLNDFARATTSEDIFISYIRYIVHLQGSIYKYIHDAPEFLAKDLSIYVTYAVLLRGEVSFVYSSNIINIILTRYIKALSAGTVLGTDELYSMIKEFS